VTRNIGKKTVWPNKPENSVKYTWVKIRRHLLHNSITVDLFSSTLFCQLEKHVRNYFDKTYQYCYSVVQYLLIIRYPMRTPHEELQYKPELLDIQM
jgi:hypothetical protein